MTQGHAQDRIALQDVMLNYAAAIDERDFERLRTCFSSDVEVVGYGSETIRGIENWLTWVAHAIEKYSATQHMLGPQFATLENDQAHTRNDVQAVNFLANGRIAFTLWATYKTTMRRFEGRWMIVHLEIVICGTDSN